MKRILGTLLACVAATTALSAPMSSTAVAPEEKASYFVGFGEVVVVPSGEAATLSFEGRRGQLVALRTSVGTDEYPKDCESIVLTRRGTEIDQVWPGLWRLPATGSYRVDYAHECRDVYKGFAYDSDISLAKVVVGRLGDALRHGVRSDAATIRAISVRLGDRPLVLSEAHVVRARKPATTENARQSWCFATRVVAGKPPVSYGGDECSFRARAGQRYLVFGDKDSTVRFGRG
ncbi:hypothetical protein L2K70_09390 [Nocardioides KLBMP 9356]|uniref:Uncharacterized protein n=1 Tax=Nocardioides potassii TaxID=2911371 RepID=A0ABS9HBT2_9ACTN|nr:hypothetical protein [Nocardioides potassii]MCF6377818.1 hypothetical protein [Nocardioides potassii]